MAREPEFGPGGFGPSERQEDYAAEVNPEEPKEDITELGTKELEDLHAELLGEMAELERLLEQAKAEAEEAHREYIKASGSGLEDNFDNWKAHPEYFAKLEVLSEACDKKDKLVGEITLKRDALQTDIIKVEEKLTAAYKEEI